MFSLLAVQFWATSVAETAVKCSWGVLMYHRNAEVCQRPRSWMVKSSTPARAADVAAPILKLWPAYLWSGRPKATKTF